MSESFGEALRRLRGEHGQSLRQLAAKTCWSPAYLSELERGAKPPQANVAAACDAVLGSGGYLTNLAQPGTVPPGVSCGEVSTQPKVTIEQVALAAAHESTTHAVEVGSRQVPPATVEQVRADAVYLSDAFRTMPPLNALLEARRVRDLASEVAGRTRKPTQVGELYLATGMSCGLLSVAAFDLGIWPAAAEQARAAHVYAELIDHRALQAWARGQQALVAYWADRPADAADLARAGLEACPSGTPRARLLSIAARAWSHLGHADRAEEALNFASDERERIGEVGEDELHDHIAGQFGWGPSRQAMCATSAWLQTGAAGRAARQAREALRLHPYDQTGTHVDAKAATDLATAELLQGRVDAAGEALERVWAIEPRHRRYALTARLHNVMNVLGAKPTGPAKTIQERIETFTAETIGAPVVNDSSMLAAEPLPS